MGDERQDIAKQIAELAVAQGRTEAKVDMALVEIRRVSNEQKGCRAHCDTEMPAVHGRITDLKGDVDRMAGFLSVHHWLLLVAELCGLGAMVYLGMHK